MAGTVKGLVVLVLAFCISVEACTVIELDPTGFVNNAMTLLHAIPMFLRQNGTVFVDNTNFQYKCSDDSGWHDFFSGEEDLVPWSPVKEAAGGEACARYNRQQIDDLMYNVVRTKPDLLDFMSIKQVWKLRPWVQQLVSQHLEELAALKRPTIGFHIRGGDLLFADKYLKRASTTPLDAVQTFARTFPRVRGGTCVMVGDEHAKVTEAAKAAERHLKCSIFRASPFWRKDGFSQDMHAKEGLDVKCGGTVKMLVDLELLAHSDYLVASDHSQWSRLLQYLRYKLYGHNRTTFVDASAEHGDLASVIRKYIRPDAFDVHHKPTPADAPVRKRPGKAATKAAAAEAVADEAVVEEEDEAEEEAGNEEEEEEGGEEEDTDE